MRCLAAELEKRPVRWVLKDVRDLRRRVRWIEAILRPDEALVASAKYGFAGFWEGGLWLVRSSGERNGRSRCTHRKAIVPLVVRLIV